MKLFLSIFLIIFSFQSLSQSDSTSNRKIGFGVEYQPSISKVLIPDVSYYDPPFSDYGENYTPNFTNKVDFFMNKFVHNNLLLELKVGYMEKKHSFENYYPSNDSVYLSESHKSAYLYIGFSADFYYKNFYIGIGPEVGYFINRIYNNKSNGNQTNINTPFQGIYSISRDFLPAFFMRLGYTIDLSNKLKLRTGIYSSISFGPKYLQSGLSFSLIF